jgi:putative sterol carrier protein
MTNPTAEFFGKLAKRGHEPLLGRTTGSLRFDLTDDARTERWLVAITSGDVAVTRRNKNADCVVRADRGLFDRIVSGRANAMTAMLQGALLFEGDPALLVRFQRLFPAPVADVGGITRKNDRKVRR